MTSDRQQGQAERRQETIHDPPVIRQKGRPREARLTGPLEGRQRGGGGQMGGTTEPGQDRIQRQARRCGVCRKEGHNRQNCPDVRPFAR